MKSPKWRHGRDGEFGEVWTIPGGQIEKDENGNEIETPEEALKREIEDEELHIKISHIEYISSTKKSGVDDFIKPNIDFEFVDFIASADNYNVTPNDEISEFGWFTLDEADAKTMIDTTKIFLRGCRQLLEQRIAEFQAEYHFDRR